jgi:hypothetical protein
MALDFNSYVAQIANIMAVSSQTPQFQTMLPGMITYAEQRIYRELDLLDTIRRNADFSILQGNRNFTLPVNQPGDLKFITVMQISAFAPPGSSPETGSRVPMQPVSREFLDAVYGSGSVTTGTPTYFAMTDQDTIIVGPYPDGNYRLEITGTVRPLPLSANNTTTFLTEFLPDLFVAASMIFASGYQRDFGAQADNPQQAASWEQIYGQLFASAGAEELRKKFYGPGWTTYSNTKPADR